MIEFLKRLYRWLKTFQGMVLTKDKIRYTHCIENGMRKYDMMIANSEDYFKERYMVILNDILITYYEKNKSLKIFDAGCGQGRLAIELAAMGHRVDAMDFMEESLAKAQKYEKERNIKNSSVNWINGKMPDSLNNFSKYSYDLVLCTEVLFMFPFKKNIFHLLSDLVAPKGILFISVRPRLYYLRHSMINNNFLKLEICANNNDFTKVGEGLSWFDPADIEKLYYENGFKDIKKWSIGMLSGIDGDPTAFFSKPCNLNKKQRSLLGEIEDKHSSVYPSSGRYIVYSGLKSR
ncbi:class I SAM-dependent methyltransferase [Candidatus Omnitrophota bacterium]